MAKQNFSLYTPRDKPKKRGPGKHKKSLSKSEKLQNRHNENIKARDKMIKVVLLMVLCSEIAANRL